MWLSYARNNQKTGDQPVIPTHQVTKQTQTIRNAESRIKKHDPSIRNHYEIANKPLTDNTRYCRKDDRTFVSMLVTLTDLLIFFQTVKFEIRLFKMVILNQIFLNRN